MDHEQDFSHWVQAAFRTMVTKFLLAALTMDPKGMSTAMTDPFPEHNGLKLDAHKSIQLGRLAGSVGEASDFDSGRDLAVRGFEPHIGLCADSSEPGACFTFSVSLSLCPSPASALSLSEINIKQKKVGSPGWLSRLSI